MRRPSARRALGFSLVTVLAGWAAYTAILSSGYFLSLLAKHRAETAWLILAGLWLAAVWWRRGTAGSRRPPPAAFPGTVYLPIAAVFLLLSVALYWPALRLGLLSDDFVLLARATKHDFWTAAPFWRPVPLMAWAAASVLSDGAAGLHAVNLVLHALNGVLLTAVARRMGLALGNSVAAGVLFVCFPASVEAVAWASGIQDVLLVTGCLMFVLACSRPKADRVALCTGLAGLVLALGSKETSVAAPALACAAWCRRGDGWRALVLAGFAMVVVYASVRLATMPADAGFAVVPTRYFVKELVTRPFATLAVPFTGAELARAPAIGIVTAWLVAALLVAAVTIARGASETAGTAARAAAWVLLAAAPVYSMFYVTPDLQGARYLYLPACGWMVLLAALLPGAASSTPGRLGLSLAAALAVAWAGGVRWHLADWQEAARLRDRVTASAHEQLGRADCSLMHFADVPDAVGGAYVFRNGFLEALGAADDELPEAPAGHQTQPGQACTVEWRDDAFRETAGGPGGAAAHGRRWSAPSKHPR